MNKREFYGVEFYAWAQQQFDEARQFLKRVGKPTPENQWEIDEAKWASKYFKQMLD